MSYMKNAHIDALNDSKVFVVIEHDNATSAGTVLYQQNDLEVGDIVTIELNDHNGNRITRSGKVIEIL